MKKTIINLMMLAMPMAISCTGLSPEQEKYSLAKPARCIDVRSTDRSEPDYSAFFGRGGQLDSVVFLSSDGSPRYVEINTYDRHGQRVAFVDVNAADRTEESSGKYSYEGKFISVASMFSMGGQEIRRWEHRNDSRHIVHSDYYEEGNLMSRTDFHYDGNRCEEVSTDADGNEIGRAEWEYFAKGKPCSLHYGDIHIRIEYDRTTELPLRSLNVLLSTIGEFIPVPEACREKWLVYSYAFDRHGNWTERTVKIADSGQTVSCISREIFR